jgi:hypothetical protein
MSRLFETPKVMVEDVTVVGDLKAVDRRGLMFQLVEDMVTLEGSARLSSELLSVWSRGADSSGWMRSKTLGGLSR